MLNRRNKLLLSALCGDEGVPSDYELINKVSSGNVRVTKKIINTSVYPNGNVRVVIDADCNFGATTTGAAQICFVGGILNNKSYFLLTGTVGTDSIQYNYNDTRVQYWGSHIANFDYNERHIYELNNQFIIDNNIISGCEATEELDVGEVSRPFSFFGRLRVNGELAQAAVNVSIYSCEFYKDEVLIGNYLPCRRKSDDEEGFYDLVTKRFYGFEKVG